MDISLLYKFKDEYCSIQQYILSLFEQEPHIREPLLADLISEAENDEIQNSIENDEIQNSIENDEDDSYLNVIMPYINGKLSSHASEFWFPSSSTCICCAGFKHGCICNNLCSYCEISSSNNILN